MRNAYDAYGLLQSTNIGRFQYTGQMWMPEVGLYSYRARFYNPRIGRFMQTDPIMYGGGPNLYAYVGNDPVNATDPFGLKRCAVTPDDTSNPVFVECGGNAPPARPPPPVSTRIDEFLSGWQFPDYLSYFTGPIGDPRLEWAMPRGYQGGSSDTESGNILENLNSAFQEWQCQDDPTIGFAYAMAEFGGALGADAFTLGLTANVTRTGGAYARNLALMRVGKGAVRASRIGIAASGFLGTVSAAYLTARGHPRAALSTFVSGAAERMVGENVAAVTGDLVDMASDYAFDQLGIPECGG